MKLKNRWGNLAAGFILLLFMGLIYAWSIIGAPISADLGWSSSQNSLVFTISMIFFCLGGIAAGLSAKRIPLKVMLWIAAACMLIGFFIAAHAKNHIEVCLTYGVLCGTGVGISYNSVISSVSKWFPDRPGFCSGTLLMGFGAGGMLLGNFASALETALGWRSTFVIFAVTYAAILVAASLLFGIPAMSIVVSKDEDDASMGITQILRTQSFWLCFVWAVALSGAGLAVIAQAQQIAVGIQIAVQRATLLVGAISVCNGLSRVVVGSAFDTLGMKKVMMAISALFLVAIGGICVASKLGNAVLLTICFLLIGFAYGGCPPVCASFVMAMYGKKYYALNFSAMNTNLIAASLLGPIIVSKSVDTTGSYLTGFYILLGLVVCVAPLPLLISRKK